MKGAEWRSSSPTARAAPARWTPCSLFGSHFWHFSFPSSPMVLWAQRGLGVPRQDPPPQATSESRCFSCLRSWNPREQSFRSPCPSLLLNPGLSQNPLPTPHSLWFLLEPPAKPAPSPWSPGTRSARRKSKWAFCEQQGIRLGHVPSGLP